MVRNLEEIIKAEKKSWVIEQEDRVKSKVRDFFYVVLKRFYICLALCMTSASEF